MVAKENTDTVYTHRYTLNIYKYTNIQIRTHEYLRGGNWTA